MHSASKIDRQWRTAWRTTASRHSCGNKCDVVSYPQTIHIHERWMCISVRKPPHLLQVALKRCYHLLLWDSLSKLSLIFYENERYELGKCANYCQAPSNNSGILEIIQYLWALQTSNVLIDGNSQRHQPHKGCSCREKIDKQMIGRTIWQRSSYRVKMGHQQYPANLGNAYKDSRNTPGWCKKITETHEWYGTYTITPIDFTKRKHIINGDGATHNPSTTNGRNWM